MNHQSFFLTIPVVDGWLRKKYQIINIHSAILSPWFSRICWLIPILSTLNPRRFPKISKNPKPWLFPVHEPFIKIRIQISMKVWWMIVTLRSLEGIIVWRNHPKAYFSLVNDDHFPRSHWRLGQEYYRTVGAIVALLACYSSAHNEPCWHPQVTRGFILEKLALNMDV